MECPFCDKRTIKSIGIIYIPPAKDTFQEIFRKTCAETFALSKKCHCLICGETKEENGILKTYTLNSKIIHLCNYCSKRISQTKY